MTNNQMNCSIIYEKIVMEAGDDEQIINYEWPNLATNFLIFPTVIYCTSLYIVIVLVSNIICW